MSGTVLQIRDNGQITLPTSIRRKTNLKSGDLLEVSIESDGSIRLTPQVAIDRSQAYFWTSVGRKVNVRPKKTFAPGA